MCIVPDPPVLICLFKTSDPDHEAFAPVRNWVEKGPGKFVVGGTQFKKELTAVKSVIPLLLELQRKGKVISRSDLDVDAEVKVVKEIEPSADFDDPHLVALVRITGCKLICVRDPRSHRFLRSSKLYRSPADRPKLYTRSKNSNLLCNANLAACGRKHG